MKKRGRNRDRQNQYQSNEAKTSKAVNTVSGDEARDSRPQNNRGGRSDRSYSNRGRRENSGRRQKVPYCCIHGRDEGHWTSECPLVKEKKEELDRATNNEQPPKPVHFATSQLLHCRIFFGKTSSAASAYPEKSQWTMASSLTVPHSESSVINWAPSYASPQCTIHSQMGPSKEQTVSSSLETK